MRGKVFKCKGRGDRQDRGSQSGEKKVGDGNGNTGGTKG